MSVLEDGSNQERNQALSGLFKAYRERICVKNGWSSLYSTNLLLNSGLRQTFHVWGAFGTENEEQDKPEVLVILSQNTRTRVVARARWNGDWPEVEGVDSVTMAIISGTVGQINEDSIHLSGTEVRGVDLERDELLDVVNKLSLSLRFI